MRLLLLEDDVILGEGLRDFLRSEGHLVDWLNCLRDARSQVHEAYDALLVDWQLPDGSGLDWIHALRRQGDVRPIIMLTARDRVEDRVKGLNVGADDYLVKPFDPDELVARLHAIRRRTAGGHGGLLHLGLVSLDLNARGVWWRDEAGVDARVELTAREWTVLEALAVRAGRIVSKSDLEQLMLGSDGEVSSNVLEVHVANLRRKLGRSLIDTVRGLGYRINSPEA